MAGAIQYDTFVKGSVGAHRFVGSLLAQDGLPS